MNDNEIKNDIQWLYIKYIPGDNRNIEKTINPKTAAITSKAMNIPRQFRSPGEEAASSCEGEKIKILFLNMSIDYWE